MTSTTQHQLKNGTTLLISSPFPNLKALYFKVLVGVGVADENKATYGLSHIVEHLVAREITSQLQSRGWLDSYVLSTFDATTHANFTSYKFATEATDIESVVKIFDAILDYPPITAEALQCELDIIGEEILERTDSSDYPLRRAWLQAMFGDSALGIDPASLRRPSVAEAEEFLRAHYSPGNVIVSVAGNVAADALQPVLEKYAAPSSPATRPAIPPYSPTASTSFSIVPSSHEQARLGMFWRLPSPNLEDIVAIDALTEMLAGYLWAQVREQGMLYSLDVSPETYRGFTTVELTAACDPAKLPQVQATVRKLLEQFDTELHESTLKEYVLNNRRDIAMEVYYPQSHSETVGWYYLYTGELIDLERLTRLYEGLTVARLRAVLARLTYTTAIKLTARR